MSAITQKIIHFSRGKRHNLGRVKNKTVGLQPFIELFKVPLKTPENFAEYLKLSVSEQIKLKAMAGYFFRTQVEGNRRTRDSGKPADIITLDFDHATVEFIETIIQGLVLYGIKFFVHSTRRHTPDAPRIRMVIFLKTPLDNDTYGPASRIVAHTVDPEMTMIDVVSFRPGQMMFMPTISKDMDYFFFESDGENLFDWERALKDFSKENGDWRDLSNLPKVPGENLRNTADKAEVPEEKDGPVGDFCRAYNVEQAIVAFDLPYEPVDEYSTKPRYTYTGGTTRNGAIVEDDGSFLTSYHGSDPVGGRTVNAWDLVKAHLFDDLDAAADEDTPMGKLPSWKAMLEKVDDDPKYRRQVMQSNYDMKAMFDDLDDESLGITHVEEDEGGGGDVAANTPPPAGSTSDDKTPSNAFVNDDSPLDKDALDLLGDSTELDHEAADLLGSLPAGPASTAIVRVLPPPKKDWFQDLEFEGSQINNTLPNVTRIVQNDRRIRGCIEFNEFQQTEVTRKALKTKLDIIPEVRIEDRQSGDKWNDSLTGFVRAILESPNGPGKPGYGMKVSDRDLETAIDIAARQFPFHPVKDRMEAQVWDGAHRAETLFIRYLGLGDTAYTRAVCRVWLLAGVTRIYEPGHKFDFVPILEGAQGIRKSTFIKTLAMGFFGNLTANFNNDQKLIEQIKNSFIIEIPELGNMSRSGVEDAKAFFSMSETRVREAYGKRAGNFKRQCIFMGSTNKGEYLRDATGNRRFWPLKVTATTIDTVALEGEILQVWAEVLCWYHDARQAQPYGELPLYLTGEEAQAEALQQQQSRREAGDAAAWAGQIGDFLDTPFKTDMASSTWSIREMTCMAQLFEEVLGMGPGRKTVLDYDHMKEALEIAGWVPTGHNNVIRPYGKQKSYERTRPLKPNERKRLIQRHLSNEDLADPPDEPESLL